MCEICNPPLQNLLSTHDTYLKSSYCVLIGNNKLKWCHRLVYTCAGGADSHSTVFKIGFFVDFLCDFLSTNTLTGVRDEKFDAHVLHSGEDTCRSELKVPA